MVQLFERLEKEAIYIVIPEVKEKAKKVEEKKKQFNREARIKRYAKQHQERVNINKIRNKVDACRFQVNLYNH
ncbi:MAG: hypothetical protein ACFFDF_02315 [Candidatus Odinarchaeota archaeon]